MPQGNGIVCKQIKKIIIKNEKNILTVESKYAIIVSAKGNNTKLI